jgi:hypothetical protein
VLYGYAVRVPAKAAWHVKARDVRMARDDVLSLLRRAPVHHTMSKKDVGEIAEVETLHTLIVPARR